MTWFRLDFSASAMTEGLYHRLCRQFQKAFIRAGAPAEMALFAETAAREQRRRVYFSPGSFTYLGNLLNEEGAEPCDCPDGKRVTLVFGVPGVESALLPAEEVPAQGQDARSAVPPLRRTVRPQPILAA